MQVQEILHEVTQNIIRSHGLTKTGASASKHGLNFQGLQIARQTMKRKCKSVKIHVKFLFQELNHLI